MTTWLWEVTTKMDYEDGSWLSIVSSVTVFKSRAYKIMLTYFIISNLYTFPEISPPTTMSAVQWTVCVAVLYAIQLANSSRR
jgi:hypothetical protein